LPGELKCASCPKSCPHDWIFDYENCSDNIVTSGSMSNIALEAEDLITPNIT